MITSAILQAVVVLIEDISPRLRNHNIMLQIVITK